MNERKRTAVREWGGERRWTVGTVRYRYYLPEALLEEAQDERESNGEGSPSLCVRESRQHTVCKWTGSCDEKD